MMPFENDHKSTEFETLKPFFLFLSFSHRDVKGLSSKRIALKVDVIGLENILFAGASVYHSARKLYRLGQRMGLISPNLYLKHAGSHARGYI